MSALAIDYLAALRLHDEDGLDKHLQMARRLGASAVKTGLGTLELAKIHEAALTSILSAPATIVNEDTTTYRATIFFNEALTPIEETHSGALEVAEELHEMNRNLGQRTEELIASRRQLAREKAERRLAEDALSTSEEKAADFLAESRVLEKELLEITRRTFTATEAERKQLSLRLHDDIAQTMLGIHVRLLALKKAVSISHEDIAEQITNTERLMAQSVKMIGNFAKTIDCENEN